MTENHRSHRAGWLRAAVLGADDGKSPILVAPIGKDCTTTAIELGLDPKRTVAVDLTGDTAKRLTIMGDKDIPYQLLRKVMVSCARAGLEDVRFAVRQKAEIGRAHV